MSESEVSNYYFQHALDQRLIMCPLCVHIHASAKYPLMSIVMWFKEVAQGKRIYFHACLP